MQTLIPVTLACLLIGMTIWVGAKFFHIKNNKLSNTNRLSAYQENTADSAVDTPPPQPVRLQEASPGNTKGIDKVINVGIGNGIWPILSVIIISISAFSSFVFNEKHNSYNLMPEKYTHSSKIKLTLEEEVLVPPPPLPPEAFTDVLKVQPGLNTASRDWALLNPSFVQQVLRVMEKVKARGYPLTLLEGYRSPERQDALAGQATLVTKAKGGQSKHQYGLAVDLAPVRDGKIVITEQDPWAMAAYRVLGEEAQAAGLTWGGIWRFRDYGHIEKRGALHR